MNTEPVKIRRALISVSDKSGIVEFARELQEMGVQIISTGGTRRLLEENGIPAVSISEITGFPEMMDGRVKTLHPLIHGGLLGLRDEHAAAAKQQGIEWIDLVVCNLYPFERTINSGDVSFDEAIEQIDIGGPSMIRSAAKNVGWVTVVVDPKDYPSLSEHLKEGIPYQMRKQLCATAFRHTAAYDALISNYMTEERYPEELTLTYRKYSSLRYGENPHQSACAYKAVRVPAEKEAVSVLEAKILGGKELSYNNINDANGTLETLREFTEPACVVVKHANPCGVAADPDIFTAVKRAFEADRLSAFGGIVAINRPCTVEIASYFSKIFFEIFLAPEYEPEALEILQKKKNLRILKTAPIVPLQPCSAYKHIAGGLLVQDTDARMILEKELNVVTKKAPTAQEIEDMLFSWKVLKHVKSNGILTARDRTTLGIGPGQVSRVDAVKISLEKSGETEGAVLASDAFFPFRDSIDQISETGIRAIIQPGGSVRDQEVIEACDEHGIAMVFTGVRCFNHG